MPKTTFEEWCFGTIKDKTSDLNGYIRGIPMVWDEPCYWRRQAKVRPYEALLKDFGEECIQYIGFTIDETNRKMSDGGGGEF